MSNCIVDIFEKTVERFPNRVAVADAESSCTFIELKSLAQKIAKELNFEEEIIPRSLWMPTP